MEDIICFCDSLGVEEVRILKLTPSGKAEKSWKTIGLSLKEQEDVVLDFVNRKSTFPVRLSFSGYPKIHPCRSIENAVGCQAGTNLLYIDINGDVFPCACAKRAPDKFKICNITELWKLKKYILDTENTMNNDSCLNEIIGRP